MNVAERKIKDAFEKAAEFHKRDGATPNEAIAKAAGLCELNPEMTRRVVEMFNIAKTNATLKTASDKTASFPIAEIGPILKAAFLDAPISKQADPDPEPNSFEDGLRITRTSPNFSLCEKQAAPLDSLSEWMRQAHGWFQERNSEMSKLAQDRLSSEFKMRDCLDDVVQSFFRSERVGKFAEFEREVLSEYGEPARPTLDLIHGMIARGEERWSDPVKLASFDFKRTPTHDAFDRLVKEGELYLEASEAQDKIAADLEQKQAEFKEIVYKLAGMDESTFATKASDLLDFKGPARKDCLQAKLAGDKAQGVGSSGLVKGTMGLGKSLSDQVVGKDSIFGQMRSADDAAISGMAAKAREAAVLRAHKRPGEEVDAEMDNVKRTAILRELLANDEILSQHDLHAIQSAYNVLLHLAPEATLNHGVTQAFLRNSIANQAVDPFTAGQVADLQSTILKNKALAKGKIPSPGA